MTLTLDYIEKLKETAARQCWEDVEDLEVDDYAGGNIDDAYSGGYRAGEVMMARDILSALDISW